MSKSLLFDETKFDRNFKSEDIMNTLDNSDFGCFVEVVLKYPDNIKEKNSNYHFVLRIK